MSPKLKGILNAQKGQLNKKLPFFRILLKVYLIKIKANVSYSFKIRTYKNRPEKKNEMCKIKKINENREIKCIFVLL